jgi:hypothetical protein
MSCSPKLAMQTLLLALRLLLAVVTAKMIREVTHLWKQLSRKRWARLQSPPLQ